MSEGDPLPPAMGERRAIGGYHPQYRVAAGLILRAFRDGTLESVRVADPEAGRVDDLQIATRGRLDAYQIKWSRHLRPSGESPRRRYGNAVSTQFSDMTAAPMKCSRSTRRVDDDRRERVINMTRVRAGSARNVTRTSGPRQRRRSET